MASSSLGTLTLDLAVRLSEFTDGLTQAEREARDSTGRISDSVRGMRDNIADDISKISGSMAGMAVGAVAVAGAAMAAFAIETANADVQLGIMAGTANTSLKSFQVLTHAAAGFGVEQEALSAILADTQEKLGEFSATGGGGAADFFEALQNNTKMTDEQIRELGKTLQSKDGVGAIQYLKDELDALGATSQEQRFIMESLAGDLGNLMPLFANGGVILEEYGVQLEEAGVIKSQEAIDKSRILAAETKAIQTKFEGVKTQLVTEMIPALGTLITHFTEGKKEGKGFRTEVDNVGKAIRGTTSLVVGLAAGISVIATSFQTVGAQMRMIAQTYIAFSEADGFLAKSQAIAAGLVGVAGVTSVGITSVTEQYKDAVTTIDKLMAGQKNRLSDLGQVYYDSDTFLQSYNEGLEISTKQADANAKAEEARAKALDKTAKAQERLVGISGNTGIGSAHLHVQYRDKSRAVSAADLARFQVGGKNISDYRKTSGYGPRNTGIKGASTYHRGTDYGVPKNTPITTSVPVKNVKTWLDKKGGGYVSTITFGDGVVIDLLHQMPGIMGIEKGQTTGNNQIDGAIKKADAMWQKSADDAARAQQKAAADAERLQQETLRRQTSIQAKYATEREKLDRDYATNVTEIESLYAEGSVERTKLLGRAKTEYEEKRQAKAKSILETYMSDEVKLGYEHNKKIDAINAEFAHDDTTREMLIDLQKAAYEEDLANFKFTAEAKVRAQYKMYKSIADSARAGSANALSTGKDSMMQRTLGGQDYESWRLNQDYVEGFDSVNNDYKNRQAEINAVDERGNEAFPELERFELLEIAKQEHLDKMWALEQEYALKDQTLAEQQTSQKIAMYQSLFSGISGLTKAFAGEQSTAYRIMFGIEQGFAIAQSAMAIQQSIAKAMTIGYPQNIPIIAETVGQGAQIVSNIKNITMGGIAHGGLDYVPKEATYLLDEGERVLSPRQNTDLTKFMNKGDGGTGDININVTVDAKGNSQMTGDMSNALGRKMAEGMKQVAKSVIMQEKRQGGLLYGT